MTWVSDLERERQTLERLIDATKSERSPSRRLSLRSLQSRLYEVQEKLADATRPQLLIHLSGSSVSGHEIKIEALGPFLDELQETVSSIGQALRGRATAFSSIPMHIREETSLTLEAASAGSVVLHLRAPSDPRPQEDVLFPVLDDQEKPLAIASVERLISVVRLARKTSIESEALVEDIYPLGARTYKHLNSLVKLISETDTNAELTLRSPIEGEINGALTPSSARYIHSILERTRIAEESQDIVGELRGVSSVRNAFELVTPEKKLISGKVRESLVPSLRTWYERPVIATLEVSVTRSLSTGAERRRYLLVGLAEADGAA